MVAKKATVGRGLGRAGSKGATGRMAPPDAAKKAAAKRAQKRIAAPISGRRSEIRTSGATTSSFKAGAAFKGRGGSFSLQKKLGITIK